jgi:hypothetical protein
MKNPFAIFLCCLPLAAPFAPQARVQPSKNHVIAPRLAGVWEADPALREQLGASARTERVEFVPDERVLATIPAALLEPLANERIFQAGTLTMLESGKTVSYPYLLVAHEGNPLVVLARSSAGGALDDLESSLLSVVPGKSAAQDLLFLGGDFANEPFRPFHRAPGAAK